MYLQRMAPAKAPKETRSRILEAAFSEIYENGFQGSSINDIVKRAGITRGALFHHFKGKNELGYAVIEELLTAGCQARWLDMMDETDDPISALMTRLEEYGASMRENQEEMCNGCPVNNLSQEMSGIDEGFRTRIDEIYELWRTSFEKAFERGVAAGNVKTEVDPRSTATFIIASMQGSIGLIKNSRDETLAFSLLQGMFSYLNSLRP